MQNMIIKEIFFFLFTILLFILLKRCFLWYIFHWRKIFQTITNALYNFSIMKSEIDEIKTNLPWFWILKFHLSIDGPTKRDISCRVYIKSNNNNASLNFGGTTRKTGYMRNKSIRDKGNAVAGGQITTWQKYSRATIKKKRKSFHFVSKLPNLKTVRIIRVYTNNYAYYDFNIFLLFIIFKCR